MNGKLIVLLGCARSGKSTLAKKLALECPMRVIANADTVRLSVHGQRYLRETEPLIHYINTIMIKSLYMNGHEVIIDETNTTIDNIRKWLEIDINARFIYLNTSPEICKKRAYETNQSDLVEKGVIDRMYRNLQKLAWYSVTEWEWDIELEHKKKNIENFEPTLDRVYLSIEKIRKEMIWQLQ